MGSDYLLSVPRSAKQFERRGEEATSMGKPLKKMAAERGGKALKQIQSQKKKKIIFYEHSFL